MKLAAEAISFSQRPATFWFQTSTCLTGPWDIGLLKLTVRFSRHFFYICGRTVSISPQCFVEGVSRLAIQSSVSTFLETCVKFPMYVLSAMFLRECGVPKYKNLEQLCWEVVDAHASELIESDAFLKFNQDLLLRFLNRDSLRMREIDLFRAFCEWVGFQNKLGPEKSSVDAGKESYLHLVDQIRFPLMSPQEFADYVPKSQLLSKDDIINLFTYFFSTSCIDVRFSSKPRAGTLIRRRLFPSSRKWFVYSGFCPDFITLTVDSPMRFLGVRMFGSENGKYSVSMQLCVCRDRTEILATKKEVYESESKISNEYFGFDVLFDEAVTLEARISYTLEVLLEGPPSFYGVHGFSEVELYGKTVSLYRDDCPVFSRFRAGQFAEIIFM